MTSRALLLLCALATTLVATDARADRRNFVFTYEPKTMTEGTLELEYYMTGAVGYDHLRRVHDIGWAHQVELEYGVTEHFDLAMYQMFSNKSWTGYKLRARYRPWYTGEMPVDLMFYLEFIHHSDGDFTFEEKVVIGKTFGKLILSLDSTVEQGPIMGDTGFKWFESLGVSYQVAPWLSLGFENQLRMRWEPKSVYGQSDPVYEFAGLSYLAGPVFSFAAGPVWWDLGGLFLISGPRDESRYLFRVLWGIHLG